MEQSYNIEDSQIVKTSKELGQAIKNGVDTIVIEGDLAKTTFKIKATGKVAWAVAIGAVGIAAYSAIHITTSTATNLNMGKNIAFTGGAVGTTTAITILGTATTWSAISIAVAAGGVGALTSLRNKYKIASKDSDKLILVKK